MKNFSFVLFALTALPLVCARVAFAEGHDVESQASSNQVQDKDTATLPKARVALPASCLDESGKPAFAGKNFIFRVDGGIVFNKRLKLNFSPDGSTVNYSTDKGINESGTLDLLYATFVSNRHPSSEDSSPNPDSLKSFESKLSQMIATAQLEDSKGYLALGNQNAAASCFGAMLSALHDRHLQKDKEIWLAQHKNDAKPSTTQPSN